MGECMLCAIIPSTVNSFNPITKHCNVSVISVLIL